MDTARNLPRRLIARYQIAIIITLMAPFLFGLYWKRASKAGILAGMFTGMAVAIALFFILGPDNSPIASSIAMIVPFGVVPIVSLFTRPPEKKLLTRAFKGI